MFTRTANVAATIELPEGKEIVMPGDDTELVMTLKPETPMESGQRFTLRESHKTIGTGVVTQILAWQYLHCIVCKCTMPTFSSTIYIKNNNIKVLMHNSVCVHV